MSVLTFENIYPDTVSVSYVTKTPLTRFGSIKFAPALIYKTKYTPELYEQALIQASNLMTVWISEESKLLSQLSISFDTHKFIAYLDSFSLSGFCTQEGIDLFKEYVNMDMITSTLYRFQEWESMFKMILDPNAFTAIKGRCIYTLLSANRDFVDNHIKQLPDSKSVILSKEIYDLLKEFPWIWMIVLYQVNKIYSLYKLTSIKA